MRSMFSVVTPRIWVSPRSKIAEPCTRGRTSTSAESVRMSRRPRPSMRKPSVRMRWRMSFFCTERYAADSSFSRPSNCSDRPATTSPLISSRRFSRVCLSAMLSASPSDAVETASTAA